LSRNFSPTSLRSVFVVYSIGILIACMILLASMYINKQLLQFVLSLINVPIYAIAIYCEHCLYNNRGCSDISPNGNDISLCLEKEGDDMQDYEVQRLHKPCQQESNRVNQNVINHRENRSESLDALLYKNFIR